MLRPADRHAFVVLHVPHSADAFNGASSELGHVSAPGSAVELLVVNNLGA